MNEELTKSDYDFLLESLEYTRLNFESTEYPTYDLKREQFARLDALEAKVRALRAS